MKVEKSCKNIKKNENLKEIVKILKKNENFKKN